MYPSNGDANGNAEIEQQSNAANPNAKASASNGPALLVIDDNSNSEDASVLVIANHNPSTSSLTNTSKTSTSSNPPAAPLPPPPSSSSSTSASHHNFISTKEKTNLDLKNDTPEQQRRRNSSIAKLLGGQPLNNQQYSEIHQQILEDQSAQNQSHNSENGIQRSRSSITRTLLMNNTEKASKPSSKPVAPSTPAFAKGVEYLLHQELDSDHASTAISRNGSSPSVFQNLNLSNTNNGQIPSASRFKRKRSIPKLLAPMNLNKTSMNIPPFALHNPIELDNSSTDGSTTSASTSHTTTSNGNSNIPSLNRSHREPIDALRFTPSTHSAFSNPGHFSGLALPNSSSAAVAAAFSYSKSNLNSSLYNQFSIHPDRLTGGNHRSFSFHYPHYPSPMKLSFQTPILPLSTGAMPTLDDTDVTANSTKRIKSMLFGTDAFEPPRKRSYSNLSNPTSASAADSYVPLKKRLLHAYQNEQDSTPTL